jgi:type III restriction enzyme
VVLKNSRHYLVETKGREDIDVIHKDRAAQIWCENASFLTGINWSFIKIPQKQFESLHPATFTDLSVFEDKKLI